MLAWVPEQNGMSMIFNEKLFFCMYPCDCENNYQLVPAQTGRGYDIMFFSEIFYIKTDILESGSTYFVFDGKKYVAKGTYYDYQARGEAIAEDIRNSKK